MKYFHEIQLSKTELLLEQRVQEQPREILESLIKDKVFTKGLLAICQFIFTSLYHYFIYFIKQTQLRLTGHLTTALISLNQSTSLPDEERQAIILYNHNIIYYFNYSQEYALFNLVKNLNDRNSSYCQFRRCPTALTNTYDDIEQRFSQTVYSSEHCS